MQPINGTIKRESTPIYGKLNYIIKQSGGTPDEYLKSASVDENTLILVDQDDNIISFTPSGSGITQYLKQAYVNNNILTLVDQDNHLINFSAQGYNIIKDTTTTNISYTVEDSTDKTYSANNITRVKIRIPSNITQGFCSNVNIKNSQNAPTYIFTNYSSFPFKLVMWGKVIDGYLANGNTTTNLAIFCDGINVYCYINGA